MSEIIIDTSSGFTTQTPQVNPLPLFGDDHPLMHTEMPEYDVNKLPNFEMTNLIAKLKLTMKLYNGIGLSANQCGERYRVFIIGTDQFQIACINPKIVGDNGSDVRKREGCLSYPGLFLNLKRKESVQVEFYTEDGELQNLYLDGITAQCFQHELDHMNGIDFTEKAGQVQLLLAKQKQQKIIKKIKRANR
jgi:peptide deformylase